MSAALSEADVAQYNAQGYLLPDPPLRALSADEAATVRQQIEEVERDTGVTANKALFMVRAEPTTVSACMRAWWCHDSLVCFVELRKTHAIR